MPVVQSSLNLEAANLRTKILNASTEPYKSDRFNVRFLGITENLSDFLSRQVRSITPRITLFQPVSHATRKSMMYDSGKIQPEPFTISWVVDNQGIVDAIIMAQIFRQQGEIIEGIFDGSNKFDIVVEMMDARGDVARRQAYRNCIINNYDSGQLDNLSPINVLASATVNYDRVDYDFGDGTALSEFLTNA